MREGVWGLTWCARLPSFTLWVWADTVFVFDGYNLGAGQEQVEMEAMAECF